MSKFAQNGTSYANMKHVSEPPFNRKLTNNGPDSKFMFAVIISKLFYQFPAVFGNDS